MKNNWEIKKLKDCINISGRIGFRGYTTSDIVKKGDGAISLSPSNIIDDKINYNNSTYISWFKYEESPEIKIKNKDIIFVKTGSSYGKSAIIKNLPEPATINPQLIIFNNFSGLQEYFFYFINSTIFQNYIKKIVVGGAIPTISQESIYNYQLSIPPLEEQEKIVSILSKQDEVIEKLEKLIELKIRQKKGLMQRLLSGKLRLKGFSGEWEETNLGKICKITTGKKDVNEGDKNGIYPFFTCAQEINFSNTYSYDKEAILIAGNGNIGDCKYYNGKFEAYQRTYILSDFNIHTILLFYILNIYFKKYVNNAKQRGVMPYIKLEVLQNFKIHIPPTIEEQSAIASILSKCDEEIELLKKKLGLYRGQKKWLMEKLLSGEIRV